MYKGRNLTKFTEKDWEKIRGRDIAMIFQDPISSLNPRMTIQEIIGEGLLINKLVKNDTELRKRCEEMIELVGLTKDHLSRYPHEFSGGQRQRIGIARVLASNPGLISADEPVSALDVSIQAQVLNLLNKLKRELGLTILFIAHDLSVVKHISDRIGVMYLGNLVELGDGEAISQMPLHPYTEALFSASMEVEGDRDRIILSGDLPSPAHPPAGCPFHTRCFACEERCKTEKPQLREFEGGRFCACHLVEKRTGKKPVAHNEALEGNV